MILKFFPSGYRRALGSDKVIIKKAVSPIEHEEVCLYCGIVWMLHGKYNECPDYFARYGLRDYIVDFNIQEYEACFWREIKKRSDVCHGSLIRD